MIKLYTLNQSRGLRIAWLLEALKLDYSVENIERDPQTQLAPASLKNIHSLGKVPILCDGELTLAESGAIVEYLITQYGNGRLRPVPNSPDYARYLQFMHYPEGSLMPLFILALIFKRIESQKMPFFVKPIVRKIVKKVREGYIQPNLTTHLAYVEAELAGREWIAGELSGADFMLSFPLQAAVSLGLTADLPNITAYVARLEREPSYLKATLRVGKLNLAQLRGE